jgi:hypothetical protein
MEDFLGGYQDITANTAVDYTRRVGPFMVVGQGMAETNSGIPKLAAILSGAVRLTTTGEDVHTIGLETERIFDAALMGTLVAEARVQFANLTTKAMFMGFTDIEIGSNVPDIQTDIITAASATVLTLVASDLVGFYGADAEVTASATEWHGVYKGGTATGEVTPANINLGTTKNAEITAGEWQVIRVEVDTNGTARWYVNGDLKQRISGAVSTTTNLKFFIGVGAKTSTIATADIDYIHLRANRDWTR